ncbi:MAG: heavy-metal-associated domain-containing protein [Bacteroidia bacterium]|jgi:copper chaperone|nr:heavy-metal-associated domain-containing protein [Bacteroidia bacterium]MDG1747529.1 heavy-metal-associated domain-containing protein [Bacteroidia bacterium]
MSEAKFKTTIQCNGCLSKVTPKLNEILKEQSWSVDLESDDRILTVNDDNVSDDAVVSAVKSVGFEIEELS